jgi:hypothetical protein
VQVHCDEGVATHIGPEPCAVVRKGRGEASVGERIGQPLSRERSKPREPTLLVQRKARRTGATARAPGRLGAVEDPGMCARSSYGNREIPRPTIGACLVRIEKAGMPKPMMHGCGKSDLAIVAGKLANEVDPLDCGAGGAKGGGQGECGSAKPGPGTEPDVPCHRRWIAYGEQKTSSSLTRGGSRMPELGTYGSVRGALSNERPYRNRASQ